MKINREWAMPNKNTFDIKPIKNLIARYYNINSIDPFANKNKIASVTNDIDPHKQATGVIRKRKLAV